MKKIAIFASGSGSNFENIVLYFKNHSEIEIEGLYCNNPDAFALTRAEKFGITKTVFSKQELQNSNLLCKDLIEKKIDYIVLAGFLWLIPGHFTNEFPNKIINIHPALLPKYGGKGMYGMNVHKKVIENKESESGITIHFVNENYDEGNILFQFKCKILNSDTSETLANKIHQLEVENYPKSLEKIFYNELI